MGTDVGKLCSVSVEFLPFIGDFPCLSREAEDGIVDGCTTSGTGTWIDCGSGSCELVFVEVDGNSLVSLLVVGIEEVEGDGDGDEDGSGEGEED